MFIFFSSHAHATVGGSINLYDFKYNPGDESIYYQQIDNGGRGCPPVLKKISLSNESVSTIFSCDEGEKLTENNWDNNYLVNQKISEITSQFKDLTPISLKKNNISIDVNFLRNGYIGDEQSYLISRVFSLVVYQNQKLVDQKEITSCDLEDPFLFQGYSIPGFNKKIMLLMSAKADCFEGGYVSDSIYVIGGLDNLDKTFSGNYKGISSIQPDKNTLIVFESEKANYKEGKDTNLTHISDTYVDNGLEKSKWIILITLIGILSFIIGICLGKIKSKKT